MIPRIGTTDIPANSWIARALPGWVLPFAQLARWDRPIGWWLLLLPGWWGIALLTSPESALFWTLHLRFLLGAILMRGAGCTWNDLCDQNFDAMVERTATRPLPNGAVRRRGAYIWLMLQLALSALILVTLSRSAILLGFFSLILVALYPLMKRITWWPQIALGITFNWGVLMASAAVRGHIVLPAFLFYLGGIAWTLGYDTIYADQDYEDDALIGVRSTARLFGQHQPILVGVSYAFSLWLWGIAGYAAGFGKIYGIGMALIALLLFRQLYSWRPGERAAALVAFKSNQLVGLVLWASVLSNK